MTKELVKMFTVNESDSAQAVGSGRLPVLSTPHMIAYMENTAMTLMQTDLQEGETSVGIEINVKHLAPTALNKEVTIKVLEIERDRKVVTYHIEARVNKEVIGKAIHKRARVNEHLFLSQLTS